MNLLYVEGISVNWNKNKHYGAICRGRYWNEFVSWRRHQMKTSSALLTLCAGNSPVLTKASGAGLCFFFFIGALTNDSVNNQNAGDLRRHRAHYDVTAMVALPTWHVSLCIKPASEVTSWCYSGLRSLPTKPQTSAPPPPPPPPPPPRNVYEKKPWV